MLQLQLKYNFTHQNEDPITVIITSQRDQTRLLKQLSILSSDG